MAIQLKPYYEVHVQYQDRTYLWAKFALRRDAEVWVEEQKTVCPESWKWSIQS